MILHYIFLLFAPIGSFFSFFTALLSKDDESESDKLNCKTFNRLYYFMLDQDLNDPMVQQIKMSFLQKSWGITRYQDAMVKVDADYSDLLYASLGALKDSEVGTYPDKYEESVQGIIDNNLAIKSVEKVHPKYEFESDLGIFRPHSRLMSEQALAIVASLSLLAKGGNIQANSLLDELLYKRLYIFYVIFPNFVSVEENSVAYYILNKTSTGLLRVISRFFIEIHRYLAYTKEKMFALTLLMRIS